MRKKRDVKYVTIKDVAAEAEVSIATVSRVLNNGIVKNERKKRVLDAINKLNYTPNNSARNLASVSKTKKVSLILPYQKDIYAEVIQGFREGLDLYKYEESIEIYNGSEEKYETICDNIERSSEVKTVVELGRKIDLLHKEVTTLDDSALIFNLGEKFQNKNIGMNVGKDAFLEKSFKEIFFKEATIESVTEDKAKQFDIFVVRTVDQALGLINDGITTKDIYVLEEAVEIHKIYPNVKKINFDFFMLGITLSRIAIKKVEEAEIKNIHFVIS